MVMLNYQRVITFGNQVQETVMNDTTQTGGNFAGESSIAAPSGSLGINQMVVS